MIILQLCSHFPVGTNMTLTAHPGVDANPVEVPGQLLGDVRLPPGRQPHQRYDVGRVGGGRLRGGPRGRGGRGRGALAGRAAGQGHGQVVAELHHRVLALAAVGRGDAGTAE